MSEQFDFNALFEGIEESLTYKTETAVLEFTEELVIQMEKQRMTRAKLAKKIGCSPAYVTKILRGSTNFTLETMIKIASALECKVRTHLQPNGAQTRWLDLSACIAHQQSNFTTSRELNKIFNQYAKYNKSHTLKEVSRDSFSFAS